MAIGGTAEQRYELAPPHVGHEDFPHSVSRTACHKSRLEVIARGQSR
jgi:hypothetical protein